MPKFVLVVAFQLAVFTAFGQLEKTLHQTFEVSAQSDIAFNLHGDYEIFSWPNDHILVETNVQLFDASEGIFEHYLKEGRYEVVTETKDAAFEIKSKDLERKAIKTKKGDCFEQVKIRIFVPDDFIVRDQKFLSRKLKNSEQVTEGK